MMLRTGMARPREYFERISGALRMIWHRQIDEQHTYAQPYTPYRGTNADVKTRRAEPIQKVRDARFEMGG